MQRSSYYKLADRTIYTGARKIESLDRLVGKQVEIRGKPVEMELEGQALREIWPGAEGAKKMSVQHDLDWERFIDLFVKRMNGYGQRDEKR